jgi:hypothetical protein
MLTNLLRGASVLVALAVGLCAEPRVGGVNDMAAQAGGDALCNCNGSMQQSCSLGILNGVRQNTDYCFGTLDGWWTCNNVWKRMRWDPLVIGGQQQVSCIETRPGACVMNGWKLTYTRSCIPQP